MSINFNEIEFHSPIAQLIKQFIQEKCACDYKYNESLCILKQFDSYLYNAQLKQPSLPKELVLQWASKKINESVSTNQRRISFIRELARFMVRMGYFALCYSKLFWHPTATSFHALYFYKKKKSKN